MRNLRYRAVGFLLQNCKSNTYEKIKDKYFATLKYEKEKTILKGANLLWMNSLEK